MADVKLAYASSAAYTITLASLASDSNRLAGRESTAVSNTSNLYIDYLIAGFTTTGTSPTAGDTIEVWAYASLNDTPTYPDVFDGTDSAETVTSSNVKYSALKLVAAIVVDSTSDRTYAFGPISLASLFGGVVPKHHGVFVTHNTDVNLNSTGGNHAIHHTGVYQTVT